MHRFTLTFAALFILFGATAAHARQKSDEMPPPPPPAPTPTPTMLLQQLLSNSKGPRASEQEVRRLVELVGVVEKELKSIDFVMNLMKRQMPTVPERVWPEVRAEFVKSFTRESIIKGYVPIYSNHFNAKEVRQLIAFYSSPVGKKLVSEMPHIETEAFLMGVERGREIGERLREILKNKGFSVPST
jgi:hypothetical protein